MLFRSELGLLVDLEVGADAGPEAARAMALLAGLGVAVARGVEVRGGAAEVGDRAAKRAQLRDASDFLEHGLDAAAGEELALVKPKAAERAAARAAPRDDHGILDRGESRDRLRVRGMRPPHEGQLVQGEIGRAHV